MNRQRLESRDLTFVNLTLVTLQTYSDLYPSILDKKNIFVKIPKLCSELPIPSTAEDREQAAE